MPARVTLHLPAAPAQVVALRDGREYVIGRGVDCDVVVDDERVSRRHAVLAPTESGWSLTDLASKNGSLVDGVPAQGLTLPQRCWLSLGGLVASFEQLSEEESRARAEERWRTSIETQRRLAAPGSLDELLRSVLDSVLELSGAERGFVLLARSDGELEIAAVAGLAPPDLAQPEFSGSIGAVEQVLTTGRPLATSDAMVETSLRARASVVSGAIRALVCVPVRALDRTIGAVYADSRKEGSAFTDLDLEILETLGSHAALAIAVTRMDEELSRLVATLPAELDLSPQGRQRLVAEIEQARLRARSPLRSVQEAGSPPAVEPPAPALAPTAQTSPPAPSPAVSPAPSAPSAGLASSAGESPSAPRAARRPPSTTWGGVLAAHRGRRLGVAR
jgi:pSer/pThr/pTyr-binding forkhead associated (FHA) protein